MDAPNAPYTPEEREQHIAWIVEQFQTLSPHRQRAYLWALEHIELVEALVEQAGDKTPPTSP